MAEDSGKFEEGDVPLKDRKWQANIEYKAVAAGRHKIVVAAKDDSAGSFQLEVVDDREPKTYDKFSSSEEFNIFKKDMADLEATKLHLSLLDGVRRAREDRRRRTRTR